MEDSPKIVLYYVVCFKIHQICIYIYIHIYICIVFFAFFFCMMILGPSWSTFNKSSVRAEVIGEIMTYEQPGCNGWTNAYGGFLKSRGYPTMNVFLDGKSHVPRENGQFLMNSNLPTSYLAGSMLNYQRVFVHQTYGCCLKTCRWLMVVASEKKLAGDQTYCNRNSLLFWRK
jgi:hypothetical protein